MKTGYYPGCSLEGTGKEFDISLKRVLKDLDVELEEIDDWSCCGASSAHGVNHVLSLALPARNLTQAQNQGLTNIMAPCAACYNRLLSTQSSLMKDKVVKAEVEDLLEDKINGNLEIINVIEYFQKIGIDKIIEKKKIDLSWLNVACYYGCLLVRLGDSGKFDDEEHPTSMEDIVSATGAKPIDWNFKTECCGAAHSISHTEIVESLTKKILDNAMAHNADVIVLACPMCHSNLDMRQLNIKKHHPDQKEIPVLYLTELIGMALGIDGEELGMDKHFINTRQLLDVQQQKKVRKV
jgi:heterodisulfide reductase subunit B